MGTRGKKSMAELLLNDKKIVELPDAPYDLSVEAADEWRAIVAAMPPNYFARTHYPVLSQLCRHIVASRRIALLIEAVSKPKTGKSFNTALYNDLLARQSQETTTIVRLARTMRINHVSIYQANNTGKLSPTPWHRDD
jgi:hypothetical protein